MSSLTSHRMLGLAGVSAARRAVTGINASAMIAGRCFMGLVFNRDSLSRRNHEPGGVVHTCILAEGTRICNPFDSASQVKGENEVDIRRRTRRLGIIKHGAITAVWLFAISSGTPAIGQAVPKPVTAGQPIWATASIQNEPLLFIQEEGQPTATAKLLFTPSVGFRITHPDLSMTYNANKDYVWTPGTKLVTLTVSSRIPFKTQAQMTPPKGSPNMFGEVLHSEGHFFHDLQVQASYMTSEKWEGPVPVAEKEKLKNTIAKLKGKQPVSLVALGDSLSLIHI